MTPSDFQERFLAGVLPDPPGLDLGLQEFERVGAEEVENVPLKAEDRALLVEVGMPRDAPPFFSFRRYSAEPERLPPGVFALGANGSGDPLCLELESGCVVSFNHDNEMERVLLNTSLTRFAECLCIYQEHLHRRELRTCMESIYAVDPQLRGLNGYWEQEVAHDAPQT